MLSSEQTTTVYTAISIDRSQQKLLAKDVKQSLID